MGRVSKRARLLQSLFGALRALHPCLRGHDGKAGRQQDIIVLTQTDDSRGEQRQL
jgi:hypothetical protein